MNEFFKNTRKFAMSFGAVLLAVTLIAVTFAYLGDNFISASPALSADSPESLPDGFDPEAVPVVAEPSEILNESVQFNVPGEMRGAFLVPGEDYVKSVSDSADAVKAEIDKAVASAKELLMNSVIIDTVYQDKLIFKTKDAPELSQDFDIMEYAVNKAREENLYVYAIFDASFFPDNDKLLENAREFAETYKPDGVLVDGYSEKGGENSATYGDYIADGGSIGYDNFLRQGPANRVKAVVNGVREGSRGTQVGLLADAVWANSTDNPAGSETAAAATSFITGNADTKGFVERKTVDFVAVKAFGSLTDPAEPFKTVVSWWGKVATESSVPMYVVHASSKACTQEAGWAPHDELTKQVIEAFEITGFSGSIFNSLSRLVENPKEAATTLVKYYKQEVEPEHILTELQITKPEKTTFNTFEPAITFTGASDPNSPVTINGTEIKRDASGYFTVTLELKAGENKFTISHKEKDLNYSITRQVQILQDVSPTGSLTTEGGMSIMISAYAPADADVYATINGQTVAMNLVEDAVSDEADRDSNFLRFEGEYTAPPATGEVQSLGSIVVYGSWGGSEESIEGATVKVNKKAKLEDGVAVVVVADQAMTYPPNTLNNIPYPDYYPLPKGAMDYAVGEEIVYKKGSETFTYTVLASGLRVESKDIQPLNTDYPAGNVITGMSVDAPKDGNTYLTLKTAQKVSYSFAYKADSVQIRFHNTTKVPDSLKLDKNPLFSKAVWSDDTLTLTLVKSGAFMGYKGYYDASGNLVLRFNNPPGSLSGARIAIDPGHGGKDFGALGFLADYPEKVINLAIAKQLEAELTARGATVKLFDNSGIEGPGRAMAAEAWNADLFVSIHNNAAPNSAATGTEIYYFHPFSKTLASYSAQNVSAKLATNNRGAKQSYYHVTLSSQMASVLVECGFMTNKTEYEKLIKEKYQQRIAVGIADSLASTISACAPGSDASGTQSVGSSVTAGGETSSESSSTEATGTASVTGVELNRATASIAVGGTVTIKATVAPDDAKDKTVSWKSSETAVATVSASGVVTGKAAGTTNITATTTDGKKTATCKVTVTKTGSSSGKILVDELEILSGNQTIDVGDTVTLDLGIYPDDADDTSVTWSSNDKAVATVSSSGKVTGVAEGTATISAVTKDGSNIKATCKITVSSGGTSSSSSGIRLSQAKDAYMGETRITLYPGKTYQAEIYSEKDQLIRNSDFTWKTDSASVATVNQSGLITAKSKEGTAEITAESDEYDLYILVTVSKTKVDITSIKLDKTETSMLKGKTLQLKATVSPSSASVSDLQWSCIQSTVCKVDSKGLVTAVGTGSAIVKAYYTKSGNRVEAQCKITVTNKAIEIDYIELENNFTLVVGETTDIGYTVYPDNATDTALTWKSDATSVVKVDSNGTVTALKKGTATITATSKTDSSVSGKVKITVVE